MQLLIIGFLALEVISLINYNRPSLAIINAINALKINAFHAHQTECNCLNACIDISY
jgi:hypothetical protein